METTIIIVLAFMLLISVIILLDINFDRKGYKIILTTGRKECMREATEVQLAEAGIFYDQLVMGIGGGPRYLINDKKPDGENACFSISLDRNVGIKDVDI
jgi:NADPH-dependent 2,4-dienoyl-CoA reductase/sulfur reductase-like enzyme